MSEGPMREKLLYTMRDVFDTFIPIRDGCECSVAFDRNAALDHCETLLESAVAAAQAEMREKCAAKMRTLNDEFWSAVAARDCESVPLSSASDAWLRANNSEIDMQLEQAKREGRQAVLDEWIASEAGKPCPYCGHKSHLPHGWKPSNLRSDSDTCQWGNGMLTCNCPHQIPRLPFAEAAKEKL